MQTILLIVNAAPYGNERMLSALRLASALAAHAPEADPIDLRLFMMSDAVTVALAGQQSTVPGASLAAMLEGLLDAGAKISLCRTCVQARGLADANLLAGVVIGSLQDLSAWTLAADKVLSF